MWHPLQYCPSSHTFQLSFSFLLFKQERTPEWRDTKYCRSFLRMLSRHGIHASLLYNISNFYVYIEMRMNLRTFQNFSLGNNQQ